MRQSLKNEIRELYEKSGFRKLPSTEWLVVKGYDKAMVEEEKKIFRDDLVERIQSATRVANDDPIDVVITEEKDPVQQLEEIEDRPHAILRKSIRVILFILAGIAMWRSLDYVVGYYSQLASLSDAIKSAVLIVGSVFIIPELVMFLWEKRLRAMSIICAILFIPLSIQTLAATMSGVYTSRSQEVQKSKQLTGAKDESQELLTQAKEDKEKAKRESQSILSQIEQLANVEAPKYEVGSKDRGRIEARIRALKVEKEKWDKYYEKATEAISATAGSAKTETRKDFYDWVDERLSLESGTGEFIASVSTAIAIDIAGPLFLTIAFNIRRIGNGSTNGHRRDSEGRGRSLAPLRWISMLTRRIVRGRTHGVQASEQHRESAPQ